MHSRNLEYSPCENCNIVAKVAWNTTYNGYLCDHCDRLAGRVKFRVNAFQRRKAKAHSWESLIPPKKKYLVAFDVDDTLFDHYTKLPAPDVVQLLKAFAGIENAEVLVWSYGGGPYAEMMIGICGVAHLVDHVSGKDEWTGRLPDLFVDDNGIGVPGGRSWLYVGNELQQ